MTLPSSGKSPVVGDVYGDELMRTDDRHDRQFAIGPTHEETFIDLIRNELKSHKKPP